MSINKEEIISPPLDLWYILLAEATVQYGKVMKLKIIQSVLTLRRRQVRSCFLNAKKRTFMRKIASWMRPNDWNILMFGLFIVDNYFLQSSHDCRHISTLTAILRPFLPTASASIKTDLMSCITLINTITVFFKKMITSQQYGISKWITHPDITSKSKIKPDAWRQVQTLPEYMTYHFCLRVSVGATSISLSSKNLLSVFNYSGRRLTSWI